jgi:ribonuclease R
MISSVAKFGIFVLLREYDIDGLVRLDDLGGERFEFDEEHLRLVAKRSGFSYSIGDMVKIQVAAVDAELGQINFSLGELEAPLSAIEKTSAEISAEAFLKKLHGKPQTPASRPKKTNYKAQEEPRRKGKKQGSNYFADTRKEKEGQSKKVEKAYKQHSFKPEPRPEKTSGPEKSLLDMILGPAKYRENTENSPAKDKPKLSKKLMFAEQSKLRDNTSYSEKNSDSLKDRKPNRQDSQKRGQTENDRGGLRKARVSSGRRKGKTR